MALFLPPGPLAAIAAATLLIGCANEQKAPQTPSSATPGMIALTIGDFQDTDGNHVRDTTTAAAYIYAQSTAYPLPMRVKGVFEFQLQPRNGQNLPTWRFDEKETEAAVRQLAPGPGYVFQLSLIRARAEQSVQREAEILCTFTPTGGQPIRARPSAPMLIGPDAIRPTGNSADQQMPYFAGNWRETVSRTLALGS